MSGTETEQILPLTPDRDAELAALIRRSLKARGLDIPGTAYYDEGLDRLSAFYSRPGRAYYVLLADGKLAGGIGLAEAGDGRCELQKLYVDDAAQGRGRGTLLIRRIEEKARELGYRQIYLETHSSLRAAIHLYKKTGYREIPRPEGIVHSAMDRFFLKDL